MHYNCYKNDKHGVFMYPPYTEVSLSVVYSVLNSTPDFNALKGCPSNSVGWLLPS